MRRFFSIFQPVSWPAIRLHDVFDPITDESSRQTHSVLPSDDSPQTFAVIGPAFDITNPRMKFSSKDHR